jgi:hypothetical protein
MQATSRSLSSNFKDIVRRMETGRDEVDRFALAQHMLDSRKHYKATERQQKAATGTAAIPSIMNMKRRG